jgi:hypothetical protein
MVIDLRASGYLPPLRVQRRKQNAEVS